MALNVNDEKFKKEVLESEIPVLVDFWAPWCAPCLMLAPVISEISKEYEGKIKVCKVNVDEARNTAATYGVSSIPTIALFKSGNAVTKTIGVQPKSELEDMIKPHI